ncbi:GNAT family N-acetyltransferase [Nostoc sp. B(2019)]|nr:GNAT family N-acetyltransferase [Nostoc sp. B(2019)]
MLLREATLKDVPVIARVHVDTWQTTYRGIVPDSYLAQLSYEKRERGWEEILRSAKDTQQFTYVAVDALGQIVGFANGGLERTGNPIYKGEINAIYILKTHQRHGIGYRLFMVLLKRLAQTDIHSMLVWVLADNSACRFYEALGGQKVYEKQIERGNTQLNEIAYGWMDTRVQFGY